jgi:hypothetical protein
MKFIIILLVSTISLCLAAEEPQYEVIQQLGKNMEIRKYASSKWVTTRIENTTANNVMTNLKLFNNLFNYISGANSDKQNIDMTAPVVTVFDSKNDIKVTKNSQVDTYMSFYIPSQFRNNTPKPTDANVYLEEIPEFVCAAIRFGGYALLHDYLKHREVLIKALGLDAQNYETNDLYAASYDSPFKLASRRNEVLLVKIN